MGNIKAPQGAFDFSGGGARPIRRMFFGHSAHFLCHAAKLGPLGDILGTGYLIGTPEVSAAI
jgi:hypothetical protein